MSINYFYSAFFAFAVSGSICWMVACQKRSLPERPVFVLMTDFGYDFAVGSIKGVIATKVPQATIIDLDHTIAKFSILSGAFVLAKSYRYFPKGTVFVAVVDPGVGTERQPLCIRTPQYTFVGPNNGLFDLVLQQEPVREVYKLDESYLIGKATTFHGRDLFAPLAADMACGDVSRMIPLDEKALVHIVPSGACVAAYIDSYGNIKTTYEAPATLTRGARVQLRAKDRTYMVTWSKTFQDVAVGEILCYAGSNGTIEVAVNQGSAAALLGICVGDSLTLCL